MTDQKGQNMCSYLNLKSLINNGMMILTESANAVRCDEQKTKPFI